METFNRIDDYLSVVLLIFVMALFVIGIPGLIIKLAASILVRSTSAGFRQALTGRSISAALVAGLLSIMTYFGMSAGSGLVPLQLGQFLPGEIGAASTLIGIMLTADCAIWRALQRSHGVGTSAAGLPWIIGSNIWIVWALLVLWVFGSLSLSDPCIAYPGALDALGIDSRACVEDPRSYWAAHPDLWVPAQKAARQAGCPDCGGY